jgi:hypothetical protein
MYFEKFENCFLKSCIQNCYHYQEEGFNQSIGQNPVQWVRATHENFVELLIELRPEIDVLSPAQKEYERNLYFSFKPAIKTGELKRAFIRDYTQQRAPNSHEEAYWKAKLKGDADTLIRHWDETIEQRIFLTCLDEYSRQVDFLYFVLSGIEEQAPERSIQSVPTPFSMLFRDEVYKMIVDKLLELHWIDFKYKWQEQQSDLVLPFLRHLSDNGVMKAKNASEAARAFAATFKTPQTWKRIRRYTDRDVPLDLIERVAAHFDFSGLG